MEDGSAAMSFLPDWDAETFHQPHQFDGKEEVYGVLIRPAIGEVLGVEPGDYVILNLQGSSGLLYVCGIFSGGSNDFANLIVSMEGLDSIYQKEGMEPQYLYTRCDFTIDPAKNRQIHEFREKAEAFLQSLQELSDAPAFSKNAAPLNELLGAAKTTAIR